MIIRALRLATVTFLLSGAVAGRSPAQDEERYVTIFKGQNAGRFTPDGKRVVTDGDQAVTIWDAEKGTQLLTIKGASSCSATDGKWVVGWSLDKTISVGPMTFDQYKAKVWDGEKGTVVRTLSGLTGSQGALALSADGKRLVSSSNPGGFNSFTPDEVRIWNTEKGTMIRTLKGVTGSNLSAVTFSTDGKRVYVLDNGTVRSWDAEKGTVAVTFKVGAGAYAMSLSPDWKRLVTADGSKAATVWDAEKGTAILALKPRAADEVVGGVAYSPDGKRIVTGSSSGALRLWDSEKGTEIGYLNGHKKAITAVSFRPDGKRVMSSGVEKAVKVWEVSRFEEGRAPKP